MARRAEVRNWFQGFTPPRGENIGGAIVLGHRRVYILPSRLGILFGAALLVLLIGSINYALALGFALTFLLAGMGLAGMVQTARNLAQLRIHADRVEPVFAGESAQFRLRIENDAPHDRPEIVARQMASGAQCVLDVGASDAVEAALAVSAGRRGWLPLGRVMLETRFPLGLFRAWSYVEPQSRCLVYPRPELGALPPLARSERQGNVRAHAQGTDDFSGLRTWQVTDSPRQVAWKSVARSDTLHSRGDTPHLRRDPMLTKQFAGEAVAELWLDLRDTPATLDLERRLSRVAGWVLGAERAGARYGLRLPGRELAPERGEAHRAACLEALALHE